MKLVWMLVGCSIVAGSVATAQTVNMKSRMATLEQANMRLMAAFFREDWKAMKEAAKEIADNESVHAGLEQRLRSAVGAEYVQIERINKQIQQAAKRLVEAADLQESTLVQTELAILQDGCIGCHAVYRPQIRDSLRAPIDEPKKK